MCLLNKVRDLAESRTGVSSKWVASFLHIFILIHEWSRFVWTSDKWFLSLQGNDAPSGNEIMLLEGNNEFHQGHAMPGADAAILSY